MMDLFQQINNETRSTELVEQTILNNLQLMVKDEDQTIVDLHEAATQWLAKLKNVVSNNNLQPEQKQNAIYALSALMALSVPEFADAIDEKGDIGLVLYNVNSSNPQDSDWALKRLIAIGRHPSISKGYQAKAKAAIEDPDTLNQTVSKIQLPIDKLMTKKLAKQKETRPESKRLGLKEPESKSPTA